MLHLDTVGLGKMETTWCFYPSFRVSRHQSMGWKCSLNYTVRTYNTLKSSRTGKQTMPTFKIGKAC